MLHCRILSRFVPTYHFGLVGYQGLLRFANSTYLVICDCILLSDHYIAGGCQQSLDGEGPE